ncbi:hypothetical protein O3M35_010992 [Rhynocoris fuscipes]|uniref:SLC26A/SulP transporter domain-containing protein n=1 Tax=Rhynocoris fuscipes TaxID=488301 RepID=A0AAW1D149_9HEMI
MEGNTEKRGCKDGKYGSMIVNYLRKRIPILVWLPKYRWKDNVLLDVIAGVTLMFINVPQGLAFSILANVDLMYGLYTCCFGAFIYSVLGTAHISSFGAVAVGSILTGEAVSKVTNTSFTTSEITTTLTFLVGIWYFIGFILRLGVITILFRKPFVSGFIASCALHILVKSIKMLFGIRAANANGLLSFFYNCYSIVEHYQMINYPTVIMSATVLAILILNLAYFRHILAKYTKFILPIEAVVMMAATLISYLFNFESLGIPVVGEVPTGLPVPHFPEMSLISEVWASSLTVAIITYATSATMTLLFNKSIDTDQELFALAATNLICCNLQCIPIANSMMRTMVAVNLEVKSLLSTIISSFLLFFIILYGGPLFYPLPNSVLGCIIVVSAGQLIIQRIKDVKAIWKSSLENGFIWLASLSAGLIADLQMSMLVGAVLTLRQIMFEVADKEKLDKLKKLEQENVENGKLEFSEPETDKLLENNKQHQPVIVTNKVG